MSRDAQEHASESFWNQVATRGDRGHIPGLMETSVALARYRDAAEKQVLLERLGARLRDDMRVLEAGCGGGRWTTWFAERVAEVFASDIAGEMVEQARTRAQSAGATNVTFATASLDELEPDGTFDLTYFGSCLHYMSDDAVDRAFERAAGWSADAGLLLSRDTVSTTGEAFDRQARYGGNDPAIYRPAETYAAVAARHGWIQTESWPTFAPPVARAVKFLPSAILWPLCAAELPFAGARVTRRERRRDWGDKVHRFFVYQRA